MPTLQETSKPLRRWEQQGQTGQGARPLSTMLPQRLRIGLAKPERSAAIRAKAKTLLLWSAALGPTALFFADKVAHLFGVCLGH